VAPGFIASPMTEALNEARGAIWRNPAGGWGEDIAARGLSGSDEAAYVTGQTLHVNGGMAMI
jgi:3-oxoacyl-[acyl-carrier protein] reductase